MLGERHDRHQDIRARFEPELPPPFIKPLKRCGGRDIHVLQREAGRRDHVESEDKTAAAGSIGISALRLHPIAERRPAGHDIGSHPDHVDPKRFEVQDIVREILRGLPRETDHDTGADLVPDFFQCPEAGVTHRPEVVAVRGVQC